MRKPRALRKGDLVALLALSSPAKSAREVEKAAQVLEGYGLCVLRGKSLGLARDYIAGSASQRLRDLDHALSHEGLRGVFFLRGGYGSAQLLGGMEFRQIARRRILIAGFSDLTSVLNGCLANGLCALHVPTLASHFVATPPNEEMDRAFNALAFGTAPLGSLRGWSSAFRVQGLQSGTASGRLIGGNLTVFTTLIGTPWLPEPRGRILFLEDVGETPYRIDRMMTHLRNTGYLSQLSGILLGQFTECGAPKPGRWTWLEAIDEALRGLRIPTAYGLPCGHGHPSLPLPLGVRCAFSTRTGELEITESFASNK